MVWLPRATIGTCTSLHTSGLSDGCNDEGEQNRRIHTHIPSSIQHYAAVSWSVVVERIWKKAIAQVCSHCLLVRQQMINFFVPSASYAK